MIKIQVFFWKFYSCGKLTCTKTFCFVISTKECICNTQFHGLVTPTVHSSTLSLKNPKLRQQLFSGKKAVPLMKLLLILKIGRGKVTIFQTWLNFSPTKIFPDFFSPNKVYFFFTIYHCGSGYIMILVCRMISKDHKVTWPYNFMGRSHSRYVTRMLHFLAISIVVVEI